MHWNWLKIGLWDPQTPYNNAVYLVSLDPLSLYPKIGSSYPWEADGRTKGEEREGRHKKWRSCESCCLFVTQIGGWERERERERERDGKIDPDE